MRTPKPLSNEAIERLAKDLKQAKTKAEFQAVQCLWLRVSLGLSADQVATAIGWHPSSVRKLQSLYLREGCTALKRTGRGGRRRQNLTLEEEQNLLHGFLSTRVNWAVFWKSAKSRLLMSKQSAIRFPNLPSIECWHVMGGERSLPDRAIPNLMPLSKGSLKKLPCRRPG